MNSQLTNNYSNFIVRDASLDDLEDIYLLGSKLNTVNLPACKKNLSLVIENSIASFSETISDPIKKSFLFVLEDSRAIGTSQIFAKHGTLEYPHTFFSVSDYETYSYSLGKYFKHKILRLGQSFDGPTEIGSLVLDENYRLSPKKHGKLLSYVRFLFMAMKPEYFSERVLAELLPPLGNNFESALWDAVGRKFTGLDYYEADQISRQNKEFITSLFPQADIHACLLPQEAQNVIGKIGDNSKGAAKLLTDIGFKYSHKIDPFDGGPHYEADMKDISIVKNSKCAAVGILNQEANNFALLATYNSQKDIGSKFRALISPCFFEGAEQIDLPPDAMSKLRIEKGEEVSFLLL